MLSATTRACGRLGVLYKDRGVIVLNKPPGLVSQGTSSTAASAKNDGPETTPPRTAFDNVLDGLRRVYGLSTNPFPVHRLDKGTTGVLVLACTKALARELSRQFRTHAIEKTYLALVRGDARTFPVKSGLIAAPLSFDDGRVGVQAARGSYSYSGAQTEEETDPGGKAARTAWEVLASSDVAPLSLVRLYPHTGLKHQLRVHMAHALGVPILGDALYGGVTAYAGVPEGRLFLHSSSISFWRYRREGLRKRFRLTISAPLPVDFIKICRDMNLGLPKGVTEGGALVDGEHLEGGEIPGVEGRWFGEPFSM
ncbi:pseudouridine synthase [Russula ochroleuca]|uniref:Pseudouridine synthase n=1 Tax=Russula ochroleuca TaxID=152965 RepID=A0A9P5TB71_9AGAM|nr:pseudouridine synthase [Russula ochroleuca]